MHGYLTKNITLYNLLNEKDKTFSFERELIISELENKINHVIPVCVPSPVFPGLALYCRNY